MPSAAQDVLAVSVEDTARALSISSKTVRRMLADGRLERLRVGRRVLVLSASITKLVGQ